MKRPVLPGSTILRGIAVLTILSVTLTAPAANSAKDRPCLPLSGQSAVVVVDLGGGSIVDFHLKDAPLNPLTWQTGSTEQGPRPMSHFLCLDRWGQPSPSEEKNGMPFHGEAAHVLWRVVSEPRATEGKATTEMDAVLPMAGLAIHRRIQLSDRAAVFTVREEVTNGNKLGRVFNMVQHPTIAPPFLDERTLVDSNASRGFMQSSPLPNPENPPVRWPSALKSGSPVDMRRLTTDPDPNVVSYVIDGVYGWVTAASPSNGSLIGYLWKTAEYPWFNAWRHVENGKPAARGLEYGTTGLHQPFPTLVKKGRIFDRPLYEYIDAGQTISKSYACFLLRIPQDYHGVARLSYENGAITLREQDGSKRALSIAVGDLFGRS